MDRRKEAAVECIIQIVAGVDKIGVEDNSTEWIIGTIDRDWSMYGFLVKTPER